jgi:hypothetical protein
MYKTSRTLCFRAVVVDGTGGGTHERHGKCAVDRVPFDLVNVKH